MTRPGGVLEYRRLRAPRGDGEALIDPALDAASDQAVANYRNRERGQESLSGRSRGQLSSAARNCLLSLAESHTAQYRSLDQPRRQAAGPIVLTGHQPQLFHPGVWFKNFVSFRLAQRLDACAVHLLIDSDIVGSPSIRSPAGRVTRPVAEYLVFDQSSDPIPYEERTVLDRQLFASFDGRVRAALAGLVDEPCVNMLWPFAVSAVQRHGNLGRAFAEARHRMEQAWGLESLEVPFSQLCDTEPFRWFLIHILCQLPRFREIYNAVLLQYRQVNRVRSRSHPVPELAVAEDWHEAPFWVWSRRDPRRRRLFARRAGQQLELTNRHDLTCKLDLFGDAARAVDQLGEVASDMLKIRSRALSTTMFARLFLGDYFLHGIGGAKYDQLTDAIIERFFGWEPPAFGVATATLKLPIQRPEVLPEQLNSVNLQLREMQFHPERFVAGTRETQQLVAAKQQWIATKEDRQRRHSEIQRTNHALQKHLVSDRDRLLEIRARLKEQLRCERLLGSREFAFCLFPEKSLRAHLLDF